MCVSGGDGDGQNEGNSKSSHHVERLLCFCSLSGLGVGDLFLVMPACIHPASAGGSKLAIEIIFGNPILLAERVTANPALVLSSVCAKDNRNVILLSCSRGGRERGS